MNNRSPFIPKSAVYHEKVIHPSIYAEQDNRLQEVVGEIKVLAKDILNTKNNVMGCMQNIKESNDMNNMALAESISELRAEIEVAKNIQTQQFMQITQILNEIREKLIEYEIEPDQEPDIM